MHAVKAAGLTFVCLMLSACTGAPQQAVTRLVSYTAIFAEPQAPEMSVSGKAPEPILAAAEVEDRAPTVVKAKKRLQCVAYARERSGLDIRGDAYLWPAHAEGRYVQDTKPAPGSVMVLASSKKIRRGHVALVTRVVNSREIRVDHANWQNDGKINLDWPVIDVSPDNDWSQVRVWNAKTQQMGSNPYKVAGFIAPTFVDARIADLSNAALASKD